MVLPDFLPNDEIDQISSTLSIPKHPYYEDRLAKRQFKINIQNVVGLANLNQRIDLDSVTRQFQSVEYKPDVFPAIVYRSKKPNVVILLFATGKLVVVGAKSERQVKKAVSKIANELGAKGITVLGKSDVAIRNVVASAELGCQIDLEDAANCLNRTIYEPDQFPGLIYKLKDSAIVFLLFASGRLVCTGASHEVDVPRAIVALRETLVIKGLIPSHFPE